VRRSTPPKLADIVVLAGSKDAHQQIAGVEDDEENVDE
jgi:hypothetical protein